ncbi:MAG: carbohydrate kinase family protein [Halanaerobiales bacterium]|nr:carbohydrate kinase family protein [Halanaerobiales bacterium]
MEKVEVVALSAASIDIVLKVDHLPGNDQKVVGTHIGDIPGGTIANFACAISRFGLKTGWIGQVGDDREGQLLLEDFIRFNVDTKYVTIEPGKKTNFTVILIDHSGEKSIVVVPTIKTPADLTPLQKNYIKQARLLYAAPYDLDYFIKATSFAQENKTLVCTDLEDNSALNRDNVARVLKLADLVIFNRDGFINIYGEHALFDQEIFTETAKEIIDYGVKLMAVSMGSNGCLLVNPTTQLNIPAIKVKVTDTTGAGDCFNAALVYGYLKKWDLASTGIFANAAAALAITAYGARGNLPDPTTVLNFCRENNIESKGGKNRNDN